MDIKNRVFEIQRLISVNKFSQAISECEKLIKKFPENTYFYNLCGLALQESDQTLKSIKYFLESQETFFCPSWPDSDLHLPHDVYVLA